MAIFKNNDMVTKSPIAKIEASAINDTNSSQTNNEINFHVMKSTVSPNKDSKNTFQTICVEEHSRNQLDDIQEDHIGKEGKEKKEEIQHTTYHVSDKNGKKITEITTTKIIEENSNIAASKEHSNKTCDILDLTDEHSLMKHLSEGKVKDKSMIAINKSSNGTHVSNNLGFKRNVLESLTTNHVGEHSLEMNSDSRNLNTHFLDENSHGIKQEDKSHNNNHGTKNQTAHLLEVQLEYKPLDKKVTDEVKEMSCNITQQLDKKDQETHLSEAQGDHVDLKDNYPNITIKLLVDTPKVDVIKITNVSSIDLRPSVKNTTTKQKISDLSRNAVKEVPKLPIIQKVNTLIFNTHKPQVTTAPTRTIFEIVNTTDCNTTIESINKKPNDLDIQRMKMSIKVEMNSENKSVPVDCKNKFTASGVQNENGVNGIYTKVDIKLDDKKNGKFTFKISNFQFSVRSRRNIDVIVAVTN